MQVEITRHFVKDAARQAEDGSWKGDCQRTSEPQASCIHVLVKLSILTKGDLFLTILESGKSRSRGHISEGLLAMS
jgi:hypothetical protein